MTTVADVLHNVIAEMLGLDKYDPESVYNSSKWADLRLQYQERRAWYDGDKWEEVIRDLKDEDGHNVMRYPLKLNPIAKMCRVHRAVMLGMQDEHIDGPPVSVTVSRNGLESDEERRRAENLQAFVNGVWKSNDGGELQFESCLLEQIYGGHVFRLNWEPWNTDLPWRIAIHSLDTPEYFFPVAYSPFNKRRILDCYIGYMINAAQARVQFGITPRNETKEVLYLEHWTEDFYEVTVDGQVPTFDVSLPKGDSTKVEMQGENPWGFVPVVYIPHERDGKFYGRDLVDGESSLVGLSKELNARVADKGEMVQDARPQYWTRDVMDRIVVHPIEINGMVLNVLDLGMSKALPGGATKPELDMVEPRGYPESLADYGNDLMSHIMRQSDVAPVALGDDDTGSGRITGPVTAYRMWPTMQHTMSERMAYHIGLVRLSKMMLQMALWAQDTGKYKQYGIGLPFELDQGMLDFEFGTSWLSMIPIERTQRSEGLNARLQTNGISLARYLELQGEPDIEQEEARIWADRERQAMIEAEAQATVFQAQAQAQARQQRSGQTPQGSND